MASFRSLIFRHRKLAALLLALTLCVKALVPAGFMIERKAMVLTVSICADGSGIRSTRQMVVPMESDQGSHDSDHSERDGKCGFASLGFGALAPVDPALLASALLFIIALGFTPLAASRLGAPRRLLPPAHAPPLFG